MAAFTMAGVVLAGSEIRVYTTVVLLIATEILEVYRGLKSKQKRNWTALRALTLITQVTQASIILVYAVQTSRFGSNNTYGFSTASLWYSLATASIIQILVVLFGRKSNGNDLITLLNLGFGLHFGFQQLDVGQELLQSCVTGSYFTTFMIQTLYSCSTPTTALSNNILPPPQETLLRKASFSWVSSLLSIANKRLIKKDDLWELGPSWQSSFLCQQFSKFARDLEDIGIKAVLRLHYRTMLKAVLLETVAVVGSLALPWILRSLLRTRSLQSIALLFITGLVIAFSRAYGTYLFYLMGTHQKAIVTSRLYEKLLIMSPASRKSVSAGDLANLVDVDTERYVEFMKTLPSLWSAPLQVIFCLGSLTYILGWASVLALVVTMAIATVVLVSLLSVIKTQMMDVMRCKDTRTSLTTELLTNIRTIKLCGWRLAFQKKMDDARLKDSQAMLRVAFTNGGTAAVSSGSSGLFAAAVFTVHYLVRGSITREQAFPSILLLSTLELSLSMIASLIYEFANMRVSHNRLNAFVSSSKSQNYLVDIKVMEERLPVIRQADGAPLLAVMKGVTLASQVYSDDGPNSLLADVNIRGYKGDLISIGGPVGSGKTALLSAFLEDIEVLSGEIGISGSMAYAPQEPWLTNTTIRDIILSGKPYNSARYEQTLFCCALTYDIQRLLMGDLSMVGQNGQALSGGQRARLSLARAVYVDADIYVLDDVLSALDGSVEQHILQHVLGPDGMLRDKLRIITTNSFHVIEKADSVCLIQDRTLIGGETLQDICLGPCTPLRDYCLGLQRSRTSDSADPESSKSTSVLSVGSLSVVKEKSDLIDLDPVVTESKVIEPINLSVVLTNTSAPGLNDDNAIENCTFSLPEETVTERKRQSIPGWVYKVWINAVGRWAFAGTCSMCVLNYICAMLATYVLKLVTETTENPGRLLLFQAMIACLQAFTVFLFVVTTFYSALVPAGIKIHEQLVRGILGAKLSFLESKTMGELLNRFTSDLMRVDFGLNQSVLSMIAVAISLCMTFVLMIVSSPLLILLLVPTVFIFLQLQAYYMNCSGELRRISTETRAPILSHFQESFLGSTVIKALNMENFVIDKNHALINDYMMALIPMFSLEQWLSIRLDILSSAFIVVSASVLVASHVSAGVLGFVMTYVMSCSASFNKIIILRATLENDLVSLERILNYARTDQEESLNRSSKHDPSAVAALEDFDELPSEGSICFEHYSMRYQPGMNMSLRDINLQIRPGEKVAVVGRTGAGKSSLLSALSRMTEAAEGRILLDGVDIAHINVDKLRSRFAVIPQDSAAFQGTLRSNLDPLHLYSDEDLCEAITLSTLADGYGSPSEALDSEVLLLGSNLSQGKRQLLGITRAMLKPARIVIVDEATATMDQERENAVEKATREAFQGKTVLTIAHRIRTIIDYDRVIVLDAGRVQAFDSPANLLRDPGSPFAKMAAQAGVTHSGMEAKRWKSDD